MIKLSRILIFFVLLFQFFLFAQPKTNIFSVQKKIREKININNNWFYLEQNYNSIDSVKNRKDGWEKINLPHTWNLWDATDCLPGYRRDISWYKKIIFIPEEENYSKYILYFEGVNITAELYVNNNFVGKHVGGYLGFGFDITKYLKKGKENLIYVKADNSINKEIIPSQKSDFFIYGGITRDVWLEKLPSVNISNLQIITPNVTNQKANVQVKFVLYNTLQDEQQIDLSIQLQVPSGKVVSSQTAKILCKPNKKDYKFTMPEISDPKLWSPGSPFLYKARILLKQDKNLLDSTSQTFGLRWYEFKEHGAFFLNGKRLLLRGTHRHEEYAGYGSAMPNKLHVKDIQMIKELGANFIRLAHYPQDPVVYQTCDKLGILVWDELPWCRGGIGNNKWKETTKKLLTEQINQNINHPSIILWSLGNEIYWDPDFKEGDNINSLNFFLTELNNLAHKLDPTRLTAIRKYYEGADIVDVFSPSIWAGWYSGVYTNYLQSITEAKKKYKRFFHAEYGGASHVGKHSENIDNEDFTVNVNGWTEKQNQVKAKNYAKHGDWSENYIVNLFDWHLHISEQLDWFTGNAQWAFKDFGTPLRPENPIPFVNQKGLVDRAGKPKDAYYVFKSYWNKNDKFCYIISHTWDERVAEENKKLNVSVYSNCDEVKLFVNGKPLDKKKRNIKQYPAMGLNWNVKFNEGTNTLVAIGFANGKQVTHDSTNVNFSTTHNGTPVKISLSKTHLPNGNIMITATVVDNNGRRCLNYNKRIYFSMNGKGKLLINYGTPTKSQIIEAANGKAQIEFVPAKKDKAIIEVRNQDFKGSYIIVPQ